MRIYGVLTVWGALVLCGLGYLLHYSATPGSGDAATVHWPEASRIVRLSGRPTLLLFLHPECPCSRASAEGFSRLLALVGHRVHAVAVFIRPSALSEGWERTAVWDRLAQEPNLSVMVDPGGEESHRFGAATSGYTVLYDPEGVLLFRGGITPARGHEGESAGRSALADWIIHGRAATNEAPVFGCPLFDE